MVVEAVIVVLNVQDVQVVTVVINVQIAKLVIHNAIQIISYILSNSHFQLDSYPLTNCIHHYMKHIYLHNLDKMNDNLLHSKYRQNFHYKKSRMIY